MEIRTKVRHEDWGRVELYLTNTEARVRDNAARSLRRSAERIAKRAKTYTPEDTGDLMNSIRVEAKRGRKNRTEYTIVMGGMIGAERGIDLDQYAYIVHEFYDLMPTGAGTAAKMEIYGDKVGAHFMTRALRDDGELAQHDMIQAVETAIRDGGSFSTLLRRGTTQ